jgi:hypothetical protein
VNYLWYYPKWSSAERRYGRFRCFMASSIPYPTGNSGICGRTSCLSPTASKWIITGSPRLSNSNLFDSRNKTGTSDEQASQVMELDQAGRVSPICMSGEVRRSEGATGCIMNKSAEWSNKLPLHRRGNDSGRAARSYLKDDRGMPPAKRNRGTLGRRTDIGP